ncbi:YdcH family protein [Enterovirga sp. GCM10030262]|uniref:YdcH family protein n=1 Tax=Enterovirga sp. GCM10030262 TaxID=3273391 RepID=UPI003606D6D1
MTALEGGDPAAASRLAQLKMEHRDLDAAIEALRATLSSDQLQLARLKRRKLRLRDEISELEDQLVPDIIA